MINNLKGQSLLETVFAIGILLIVVTAIMGLTVSNISGQAESEFQITANNLAREGIEVARNKRDANWLAGKKWDDGLTGGSEAIAYFDYLDNTWEIIFNPTPLQEMIYSHDVNGDAIKDIYNHEPSIYPTPYGRILYFEEICLPDGGTEYIANSCLQPEEKIGLKIKSVVSWVERNRARQVQLEDLLYAWK